MSIIQIPVNILVIHVEVNDKYKHDSDKVFDVRHDIRLNGVQKPITVIKIPNRVNGTFTYEVVDGFLRLMACKFLRIKDIPAIVVDVKSEQYACHVKNITKTVQVLPRVTSYKELENTLTINKKVLCHVIGLSSRAVNILADASNLSEEVIKMVDEPDYTFLSMTSLAELAKCNFPPNLQPLVIKRLRVVCRDMGANIIVNVLKRVGNPPNMQSLENAIVDAYNAKTLTVRHAVENAIAKEKKKQDEIVKKIVEETIQRVSGMSFLQKPGTTERYPIPDDLTIDEYNDVKKYIETRLACPPEKRGECIICMIENARNVVECAQCRAKICACCIEKLSNYSNKCPHCRGIF